MEDMFGMQPPAMSETFYEVIEKMVQGQGGLLENFRTGLMQQCATMYAKAIE